MPTDHPTRARWISALASSDALLLDLYLAASEICDDFEDYGPVLQGDENGAYGESTAIARLTAARNALKARLAARDDSSPG